MEQTVFTKNTALVCTLLASVGAMPMIVGGSALAQQDQLQALEEVIVTTRKGERSLQEEPVAISVLTGRQLERHSVFSLDGLADGQVPSLRIVGVGNNPTTLSIAIRGNGPTDVTQVTREQSVAIYQDGFYLGRAQGLAAEFIDVERVEVLRGPQGTLFGRNATGGAINLIARKPTGEWGFKQTVGYGNLDALRTVTSVNLPSIHGVSLKFDYVHSERDGWVNNAAPGESDYAGFNKDGGRISLRWQAAENFILDYTYDRSEVIASQWYFQLQEDTIGVIGVEPGRQRTTRFDIAPLEPSETDHEMHALTLTWNISDTLTARSLTSYRELDESTRNNYAGVFYFNGLIISEETDQEQISQELQLIGESDRLDWVAGLYYYDEDVTQDVQNLFSLDIFGLLTGTPLTPINPPTAFDVLVSGADVPLNQVAAEARSKAIYGQATWTPPILDDRLSLTVGLRYTDDDRSGSRDFGVVVPFDLNSDYLDPLITVDYAWTDNVLTYFKWSRAHRAGGVSARSGSFAPFNEERVDTLEIGLKSEFLDQRLRVNAALFATDIDGSQLDFLDPANILLVETINAERTVEVDGLEIELTAAPLPGLVVGLTYTYLDGDMPLQPNPLGGGVLEQFNLVQTPEHAGSAYVNYTFRPFSFGTLNIHADLTATDEYAYVAFGTQDLDSYALLNARATLTDIPLGRAGALEVAVWGRNLTDTVYVPFGLPVTGVGAVQVFATPRTYGAELTYVF